MIFTAESYPGPPIIDWWGLYYRYLVNNVNRYTGHGWQYNYILSLGNFQKTDIVADIGGSRCYLIPFMCDNLIDEGYIIDPCYESDGYTFKEWHGSLYQIDSVANGKCNVIRKSAEDTPFRDNYFDKIITCSVLEHCINDDSDIRISKEIYRILKPGGMFFGTVDYNPITALPFGTGGGIIYTLETFMNRIIDSGGWQLTGEILLPSKIDDRFYTQTYEAIDQLFFFLRKP